MRFRWRAAQEDVTYERDARFTLPWAERYDTGAMCIDNRREMTQSN